MGKQVKQCANLRDALESFVNEIIKRNCNPSHGAVSMSKIKLFCTFKNELDAQESGLMCKYDFDKGTLIVRSDLRKEDIEIPDDSVFNFVLEVDDVNEIITPIKNEAKDETKS